MPYNQARRGIRGSPQQILFAPPNFVPRKSCFTHNKNKNLAHLKMFSHPNLKNLTTGLRISRRVYSHWCAIIPLAHHWPRVSGSNWFHWLIADHVSRDRTDFIGPSLITCLGIELISLVHRWPRVTESSPFCAGAAFELVRRRRNRGRSEVGRKEWAAPRRFRLGQRRATTGSRCWTCDPHRRPTTPPRGGGRRLSTISFANFDGIGKQQVSWVH